MAGVGLLALIDDIATLLDDVAILAKVAAKKTAGVLGDDLALNAQQLTGIQAERELPVVWAVSKGSFINKLILVPAALLISAIAPWLITPMLMIGGAFLCFEGCEKLAHRFFQDQEQDAIEHKNKIAALVDEGRDMVEYEKEKIKGAIRTDFILSAEIIVIALGTLQGVDFTKQVLTLSIIAIGITIFVYGIVAGIVKLDDLGFHLLKTETGIKPRMGRIILKCCPVLMKGLSIFGTAAMFLVGGGILVHGIPFIHHLLEGFMTTSPLQDTPWLAFLIPPLFNGIFGVFAGAIILILLKAGQKMIGAK